MHDRHAPKGLTLGSRIQQIHGRHVQTRRRRQTMRDTKNFFRSALEAMIESRTRTAERAIAYYNGVPGSTEDKKLKR